MGIQTLVVRPLKNFFVFLSLTFSLLGHNYKKGLYLQDVYPYSGEGAESAYSNAWVTGKKNISWAEKEASVKLIQSSHKTCTLDAIQDILLNFTVFYQ